MLRQMLLKDRTCVHIVFTNLLLIYDVVAEKLLLLDQF